MAQTESSTLDTDVKVFCANPRTCKIEIRLFVHLFVPYAEPLEMLALTPLFKVFL